jgi:hypothetical protein
LIIIFIKTLKPEMLIDLRISSAVVCFTYLIVVFSEAWKSLILNAIEKMSCSTVSDILTEDIVF